MGGDRHGYLDKPEWSKEKIEAVIRGATENDVYVIEPVNDSWPKVKQYSIELIKTIRAIDPDNVSLITWSISDKAETCSMLKPGAAAEGNLRAADLKDSGIKTRELLRETT